MPLPRLGKRARRVLVALIAVPLLLELGLVGAMKLSGNERGMGPHPVYGWRMLAGVERTGAMWGATRPARTNSSGWRDRERAAAPAEGVRRVVVLGDSFTFGVGADDGDRFTELLEARRADLEVLNFGVNGYGTDQALCVLREEGLGYAPDVVVYESYLGNDLVDIAHSVRHRWPKPWFSVDGGALVEHPPRISAGLWLRSRFYLGEAVASGLDHLGVGAHVSREDVGDPEELYLALLTRMQELTAARGARFIAMLVHEPSLDMELYGRVRDRLAARGIEVLDLEPAFAADGGEGLFNPLPVGHWNRAGHGRVADALEGLLDQAPPRRNR